MLGLLVLNQLLLERLEHVGILFVDLNKLGQKRLWLSVDRNLLPA
jgi:hypothetical protein